VLMGDHPRGQKTGTGKIRGVRKSKGKSKVSGPFVLDVARQLFLGCAEHGETEKGTFIFLKKETGRSSFWGCAGSKKTKEQHHVKSRSRRSLSVPVRGIP